MKSRSRHNIAHKLICACLFATGFAGAQVFATEVYHWKDAHGESHFSDQRSAAQGASRMNVEAPEQQPNPELDEYRKSVRINLAMLDAERKEEADRAAAREILAADMQKSCRQIRNAIRVEQAAAVLYTFDEKGEMQHLDDNQRTEYKANLNRQWQQRCD